MKITSKSQLDEQIVAAQKAATPMPNFTIPTNPTEGLVAATLHTLQVEAKRHGWPNPKLPKILGQK
ncbi:MAG: hypothetical protein ACOZAO_05305 [Patescibacteria group bacterium]